MPNQADYTQYTYSAGMAFSFEGAPIYGVYACSMSGPSGGSRGRNVKWTDNAGSATISLFGSLPASMALADGVFAVNGGGADFASYAYVDSIETEFELNGVTRTTVTFQFIQ